MILLQLLQTYTVDLCRCGDKTILVKKEGALLDPEVDNSNYVRIETMHPSIKNIDLSMQTTILINVLT